VGRAARAPPPDDTEEVIRERMAIYHKETAPLIAIYEEHGVLIKVDGMGTVDEVTERVIKAVEETSG
jgi:adenylate kinase